MLEVTIRILSHYSYGIRRLTFYKYDNSKFDHIDSLESLLKNVPVPLKHTNWGGFTLNSKGLRTPEYQVNKSPNSIRIITIGDSFTFSSNLPYPYHFTVILEDKLESWLRNDVEIINLGIPSVGPQYEQKMLEIEGMRLNPDLVIWAFFVGNDFTDETPLGKEKEISISQNILTKCYFCRLIRNGYILYSYIRTPGARKINKTRESTSGTYIGSPNDYDPNKPTFEKGKFIKIQSVRMGIYEKETFPWDQWKSIQQTLIEVRDTCRYYKIPLLVVIIPDENQVNSNLLEEVVKELRKTMDDFQMGYPQKLLTDFFERYEIDYLDLLPVFKKMGDEKSLYTMQDTHWNIDGNLLAAETIFKYLVDRKASLFNITKSSYNGR